MVDSAKRYKRIIFICDWNSARSPMAEALLKYKAQGKDDLIVASAGIEAADYLDAFVISLMRKKYQLDIISKVPQAISDVKDFKEYDLVIALSYSSYNYLRRMKAQGKLDGSLEYWETMIPPDKNLPRDMIMDGYELLLNDLQGHIDNRFADYI